MKKGLYKMAAQVIINNDDNVLGYYKDLKEFLKDGVKQFIKDEFEAAAGMLEELIELEEYKEESKLLILSENNGMGFSVRVFKNE